MPKKKKSDTSEITDQLNTDKVILELTDNQAYVVRDALELYARVRNGHFEYIWDVLVWDCKTNGGVSEGFPDHEIWHSICNILKRIWFPNLTSMNSNWGVGHDKLSDRAWTTMEVLRHYLAWKYYPLDDEHGFGDTHHDKPMNWLSNEPMPIISKKE